MRGALGAKRRDNTLLFSTLAAHANSSLCSSHVCFSLKFNDVEIPEGWTMAQNPSLTPPLNPAMYFHPPSGSCASQSNASGPPMAAPPMNAMHPYPHPGPYPPHPHQQPLHR